MQRICFDFTSISGSFAGYREKKSHNRMQCFFRMFLENETVSQIFPMVSQITVETRFAATREIH